MVEQKANNELPIKQEFVEENPIPLTISEQDLPLKNLLWVRAFQKISLEDDRINWLAQTLAKDSFTNTLTFETSLHDNREIIKTIYLVYHLKPAKSKRK
jgi:hypothetical protein